MNDTSSYTFLKQLFVGILLMCSGVIISLIVIEIGVRLLIPSETPRSYDDRPAFYFKHEGFKSLQDSPFSADKRDGVDFRIGVVGDSFTFAPYMQYTDSFPKVLERMLNQNKGTAKAEVINYGVPGYSTSHEIQTTREAIADKADLILLQITLNDPEIKPYRPIGITVFNTFGELALDEGYTKSLLTHWKSLSFVLGRIHAMQTRRDYVKYFHDLFNGKDTWNQFSRSIKRIKRISQKNDIPVVAVLFPLFGMPLDDNYPFFRIHQKVKSLLDEHTIPTHDLFETFRGVPLDRIQVIPGRDRHPNEIGHRIAAESIYLYLSKNNFIPHSFMIKQLFQKRTQITKEVPLDTLPAYR